MFKRKVKDPSVPFQGTSKDLRIAVSREEITEPCGKRFRRFLYDKEKKEFCGRRCKSWLYIVLYSIIYLIFLSTYTMLFLYGALSLIKYLDSYESIYKIEMMTYSANGIGLSATPTSVNSQPVISYRSHTDDDQKYVKQLETFFARRKRSNLDLGPCGSSPFGYWNEPCVIIRINKQLRWSAKPLNDTDANIPQDVRSWMERDRKLWLHCQGFHSYDKEHIGKISYFPDPPGFDPQLYPTDLKEDSPLVAVQFTDFTFGISLAVECTLYYDRGSSSIAFLLYVTPKRKVILNSKE